jgi:hypothetical protein
MRSAGAAKDMQDTKPTSTSVVRRVEAIDWTGASAELDDQGWALIERMLDADECRALTALYGDDRHFRSHIVMARHGFGRGEYKYFKYPLPDIVAHLRAALYARLAPFANRWNERMGIDVRYPDAHADFITRIMLQASAA